MTTQTKQEVTASVVVDENGEAWMRVARMTKPTILEEFVMAKVIANKVLDRVSGDPDDDLAILARQFLRALERTQAISKAPEMVELLREYREQHDICNSDDDGHPCPCETCDKAERLLADLEAV